MTTNSDSPPPTNPDSPPPTNPDSPAPTNPDSPAPANPDSPAPADPDEEPLARARRIAAEMGALDKAAQMLGITIEDVGPGRAITSVTVTADMLNGVGVLHGGITFMLADMAFGVAANSHGMRCVTRSSDIEYLKPARIGDRVTAVATERRRSGRSGTYDVAITGADGALLAEFRGRSTEFHGEKW